MTFRKWIKYTLYTLLIVSPVIILMQWKVHTDPVRRSVEASLARDQGLFSRVGTVQEINLKKSTYVQPGIRHSGERTEGYNLYHYYVKGRSSTAAINVRVAESELKKTDGVEYSIEYQR